MLDNSKKHWFGEFKIGDKSIFGELTIDGSKTNLYLQSKDYFTPAGTNDRTIHGVLQDGRCVSLLQCNISYVSGSGGPATNRYHYTNIFAHHVVIGGCHILHDVKSVQEIYWLLDDINLAFYDFESFGSSAYPEKFIDTILADHELVIGRKLTVGPAPEVQFFTGHKEPFTCDVGFGKFVISHDFSQNIGGVFGVAMNNVIGCRLEFYGTVDFSDALLKVHEVSAFLGIVIGRPQNVEDISLSMAQNSEDKHRLKVHSSLAVKRDSREAMFGVGPSDVLLDGIRRQEEFSKVIKSWLDQSSSLKDSRSRFLDSFSKQSRYGADRIIAAANLFDIISNNHFPKIIELEPALESAIKNSRNIFEGLAKTEERGHILGELNRLGQPKLKSKIKNWSSCLPQSKGDAYEELSFVIDQAVNCRNYFVHGGKQKFDYFGNARIFEFLTRALEICYIFPIFIKSGWDWNHWKSESSKFHPFGDFTYNYSSNLLLLRSLVDSGKADNY